MAKTAPYYGEIREYVVSGKKLLLSPAYVSQCEIMKERIKNNYDNVFLITGMEGTGKSRGMAIPTAYYLSGPNIKIIFTWEQFCEEYDKMTKGGTLIWDEFVLAGMSTDALSEMQKNIIKKMATGREDHMINLILIIPSVFLLKNYFAVFRALFQIHTDSPDFLSRGDAYFYSFEDKRVLYNINKKTQYTDLKLSSFKFRFIEQKEELYDMKEYARMKKEAIANIDKEQDSSQDHKMDLYWKKLWLNDHTDDILSMSGRELSQKFGRSIRQWERIKDKLTHDTTTL